MPAPDIEALLRHRPFVRRLARRLMGDDAGADDLVQDTYVTALENPPRHDGALRAWLATIARKLAWTRQRGERRRARHERAAAPPSPDPSPSDLLERAQWHQRLVNLVMQLDEPYRSTVLLRYFEDRNSAEIARVQGVPAATVRTRLKRALEQVRERLDREDGGRAAWMAGLALLALPRVAAPAAPALPGVLRAAGMIAAAGASLLALAGVVLVLQARRLDSPERTPVRPDYVPLPEPRPAEEATGEVGGGPLTVTVLADGRPVADARVWLLRRAVEDWRPTPYEAWSPWREGVTGTAGRVTWFGVPVGYVRILAHAPGRARGEAYAHLPIGLDAPVVLELAPARSLSVQVVEDGTGRPVAGARLRLTDAFGWPWLPGVVAHADADGRAVLDGAAEDVAAGLHVEAEGYEPWRGPADGAVRLLPRRRTVRWAIAGPGPAEGTPLVLRRIYETSPDPARARVDGGEVVAEGLPAGLVPELLAVAPDGSFARVAAEPGDARGPPVRFALPPVLEVVLRDERGAPAGDIEVGLFRAAGNVPVLPGGRTGASGVLRLPVYAAEEVDVRVRTASRALFRSVGTFDPKAGAARVEGTVAAGRAVEVRYTPWPLDLDVFVGRVRLAPEEVAESGGTLRFRVRGERPGGMPAVHLLAPGWTPATLEVDPGGDGPAHFAVDLAPAGRLHLRVVPAHPGQPYRLALLRDGDAEAPRRGPWAFRLYPGPDHVVRETMLPPGHYRVRDLVSGVETPEFEAPAGGPAVEMRLALPDPARPEDVIAGVVDGSRPGTEVVATLSGGEERVVEVARDGTFRLSWSGDVATLRARHPAAEAGPPVTVALPRDDVVLHLAPRHRAGLRIVPPPAAARRGGTEPSVRLGTGARLGAVLDGDRLVFVGYEPCRTDLWIDVDGYAPCRLPDVVLGEGETDLGTIALVPGSTLRFHVLGRDREALPSLLIAAQAEEVPAYQRSVATDGGESAQLSGLGRGTFRVTAWDRLTGRPVWTRTVTVDGIARTELEIDLR